VRRTPRVAPSRTTKRRNSLARLLVIFALAGLVGCGKPNQASIELRKKHQELERRIQTLDAQRRADQATIAALEKDKGTLPTLPSERMDQLFTVAGLEIDKLTGFRKEGLKVYATPVDKRGDILKTAGSLTVSAFDLSKGPESLLGQWEFPLKDAGDNWYQSWIVTGYALTCPLTPPASPAEITVRVSFTDALTGRSISAQRVVKATVAAEKQ
jgi:hypothetical protein